MNDKDIQWHAGFVAAINLELAENRADLEYQKEYNLNTKPLEIDLLVIKKNRKVQIHNEIGKLFREHNIMEYKSPQDHLDIDTFYKSMAYASLYKSYGETVDAILASEVTVSNGSEVLLKDFNDFCARHGIPARRFSRCLYQEELKMNIWGL